ncbi:hypothetical protein RN001_001647 [Aquatica leii]|uniref:Uncharacterized protein n=1 Tax=Aquatica leii TaxID=1421715 RepID=A0AAN7SCU5_9COLE|nr:hypothetical protein RN001_001647 [Aquatica leii]
MAKSILLKIFLFYVCVVLHKVSTEMMTLDSRVEHCLWNGSFAKSSYESFFRKQIAEEYAKLQIVTGLTRYHLNIFGDYNLIPTNNKLYGDFLICSWSTFGYIKNNQIIYDSIEMALREALIREVGATGPGTNLSILQARSIINTCKTNLWMPLSLIVINLQNCIHTEIKYLNSLNS